MGEGTATAGQAWLQVNAAGGRRAGGGRVGALPYPSIHEAVMM